MTTADRTTRRVYSAEQLHKLRGSFSAPKLREAIEEHDGEDAELVKGTLLQLSLRLLSRLRRPSLRSRLTANLPELEPLWQRSWHRAIIHPSRSLTGPHLTSHTPHPFNISIPYCHCTSHPLRAMSNLPREPSFNIHKEWVLKNLLETPSPKRKHARDCSLTEDESPVHVLRESKSFAARSFRSRTHANSVNFASNKLNDENIAIFVDANQDPPPPVIASSKPHVLEKSQTMGKLQDMVLGDTAPHLHPPSASPKLKLWSNTTALPSMYGSLQAVASCPASSPSLSPSLWLQRYQKQRHFDQGCSEPRRQDTAMDQHHARWLRCSRRKRASVPDCQWHDLAAQ